MKKLILLFALLLALTACASNTPSTDASTGAPQTSLPTQATSLWQTLEGGKYYFDEKGEPVTGWLTLDSGTYYLDATGKMVTGWVALPEGSFYLGTDGVLCRGLLELEEGTYYCNAAGAMVTGWLETEDGTYYFDENGLMALGWVTLDGVEYYLGTDGKLCTGWTDTPDGRYFLTDLGTKYTGWLDQDQNRYYMASDGKMTVGWATLEGDKYYFREDGTMARGQVDIGQERFFFDSFGKSILLVNPWNLLPQDYEVDLVSLGGYYADSDFLVASQCADALMRMIEACNYNSGSRVYAISGYRDYELQVILYERKVAYWQDQGYSLEDAKIKAATIVAVPGTSEHHTGLAMDIIDTQLWDLTFEQANLAGQQWLMNHCWEYGFILRYPEGTTDITGIIYEPWHYRYVGVDVAKQIHDAGITLEEYIAGLTRES